MIDLALMVNGEAAQRTVDERLVRYVFLAMTLVCEGPRSDERKET